MFFYDDRMGEQKTYDKHPCTLYNQPYNAKDNHQDNETSQSMYLLLCNARCHTKDEVAAAAVLVVDKQLYTHNNQPHKSKDNQQDKETHDRSMVSLA